MYSTEVARVKNSKFDALFTVAPLGRRVRPLTGAQRGRQVQPPP